MKKTDFLYMPWFLFMCFLCYSIPVLFALGWWFIDGGRVWGYAFGVGSLLVIFHTVIPLLEQAENICKTGFRFLFCVFVLSLLNGAFLAVASYFLLGELGSILGVMFTIASLYLFLLKESLDACSGVLLAVIDEKRDCEQDEKKPQETESFSGQVARLLEERKLKMKALQQSAEERAKVIAGWAEKRNEREELVE